MAKLIFTPHTLKQLKKKYNKTIEKGEKSFKYSGQTFDAGYAKYLIEYLESEFKTKISP